MSSGQFHCLSKNNVSTLNQDSIPAIPIQEFISALVDTSPETANAIGNKMHFPDIWVFSPQGNMTRMVSGMDQLNSFAADFEVADPKLSAITCRTVESAARTASKTEWESICGKNQWVALILVNKDRVDTCATCQEYLAVLDQIKEKHAIKFQSHVFPMDMN